MHARTGRWRGAALALLLTGTGALAHHGWSNYQNDKPQTLEGTIQAVTWGMPHGHLTLQVQKASWDVVLAPPSRMENRGLPREWLKVGASATVEGYPNRNKPEEMRAERITINGKTIELR
jgi:hypothetical protein